MIDDGIEVKVKERANELELDEKVEGTLDGVGYGKFDGCRYGCNDKLDGCIDRILEGINSDNLDG